MPILNDRQKQFLEWVVSTQQGRISSTISKIILDQGNYGNEVKQYLNEIALYSKNDYLKFLNKK